MYISDAEFGLNLMVQWLRHFLISINFF